MKQKRKVRIHIIFCIKISTIYMDFYTKNEDSTVIRSTNNASFLGYKFNQQFDEKTIDDIWQIIRVHKRFSVIFIFILFLNTSINLSFAVITNPFGKTFIYS